MHPDHQPTPTIELIIQPVIRETLRGDPTNRTPIVVGAGLVPVE
ncbi:hypothetical protein ACFL41_01630 [Gemmatimonadota bacterium]